MNRSTLFKLYEAHTGKIKTLDDLRDVLLNIYTVPFEHVLDGKNKLEAHTSGTERLKDPVAIRDASFKACSEAETLLEVMLIAGFITKEEYESRLQRITDLWSDIFTAIE